MWINHTLSPQIGARMERKHRCISASHPGLERRLGTLEPAALPFGCPAESHAPGRPGRPRRSSARLLISDEHGGEPSTGFASTSWRLNLVSIAYSLSWGTSFKPSTPVSSPASPTLPVLPRPVCWVRGGRVTQGTAAGAASLPHFQDRHSLPLVHAGGVCHRRLRN